VSVVVRTVAASPVRTASQAWHAIVALLCEPGSAAAQELLELTGLGAMLIADQVLDGAPVVVLRPTGPRVRVYTVTGDQALDAHAEERPLLSAACTGTEWELSVPCPADEFDLAGRATSVSPHVSVRDAADGISVDSSSATTGASASTPATVASGDWTVDESWMRT
jgi:hypothetical protein